MAEKTYDDNRDDAAQMPKAAAGEGAGKEPEEQESRCRVTQGQVQD